MDEEESPQVNLFVLLSWACPKKLTGNQVKRHNEFLG